MKDINQIVPQGDHLIQVWKPAGYWATYAYEGHTLRMNNPKVGSVVQLPFGKYYKVANVGPAFMKVLGSKMQVSSVFLKEWKQ